MSFSARRTASDWLPQEIEERVWAYIQWASPCASMDAKKAGGGVAPKHRMAALQVRGIEDHIHVLVTAPAVRSPSETAQYLKGDSSKWIRTELLDAAGRRENRQHDAAALTMNDPKASVLNRFNQCHDVPNLFITDGSCMVSTACQNPSVTYMALTARACGYAVTELKRGAL